MATKLDITGLTFGRLTALYPNGHDISPSRKHILWKCICDCGKEVNIRLNNLRSGHAKSCGCIKKEGNHTRKHGMTHTAEYQTWARIKARCNNPKHKDFADYGGRGIKICSEWANSFEKFFLDMGKRPEGMTSIDKLAELRMKQEEFRITRGDKAFEQAIQTGQLENQRIQAEAAKTSAGKLGSTAQLIKDLGLPPTLESVKQVAEAQYGPRGAAAQDRNEIARQRNEIARQRLLNEDMMYASARMAYVNATDPTKKAEALRKMKEIERLNGIVDESEQAPIATQLPPGVTVKRVGP